MLSSNILYIATSKSKLEAVILRQRLLCLCLCQTLTFTVSILAWHRATFWRLCFLFDTFAQILLSFRICPSSTRLNLCNRIVTRRYSQHKWWAKQRSRARRRPCAQDGATTGEKRRHWEGRHILSCSFIFIVFFPVHGHYVFLYKNAKQIYMMPPFIFSLTTSSSTLLLVLPRYFFIVDFANIIRYNFGKCDSCWSRTSYPLSSFLLWSSSP